ncbi:MAG: TIGR03960 family B12-binding radical SAM protein, partial [Gemmatimonadota bacterium]|nr:TIGR03960 family B12-binding radical SAM protein [Gemmatimonadota bacterium]
ERAFAPWPDAEKLLRDEQIPLYGLESYTPLGEFDLLGITLQSELTYTNVLNVLDLAGVPLRAKDRAGSDPLVCGGGPCVVNPEVMAPFFDFILLGDGEAAMREITGLLLQLKQKRYSRPQRLEALKALEGVYVPDPEPPAQGERIAVRRVNELDLEPATDGLPVPLTRLVQHHFPVEIMRGCTSGCRFCQAGMFYRPVRVRSVGRIIDAVRKGVRSGGWDSVTLLSLSAADYPAIMELAERILPELHGSGVSLSFPSLRVDSSTLELLERIGGGRKSGLTFAVEAGSERLRRVIGKKVDEDELIRIVTRAFKKGWTLVKLYFMLGLPTETEEDIDLIAGLINKVANVGRSVPGRHNVNVSLSSFVPKPGTPFQWEPQATPELLIRKINRIRSLVRARSVTLKVHDPHACALEGVLARGGRSVAGAVQAAWELGARFDGWSEHFNRSLWYQVLERQGMELESFLEGPAEGSRLPWHFVGLPVRESFLADQRAAGLSGEGKNVSDCKDGPCLRCGVLDNKAEACRKLRTIAPTPPPGSPGSREEKPLSRGLLPVAAQGTDRRLWRVRYSKKGLLRFVGHLDMISNIEFMLRRSGVEVLYSGGFSPRMRLHFSQPLPLGIESEAEYFDLETLPSVSERWLREALDQASSGIAGFGIKALAGIPQGVLPQLATDIVSCLYTAETPPGLAPEGMKWEDFLSMRREICLETGAFLDVTSKKGRKRKISLRQAVESISPAREGQGGLSFALDMQGENTCRPDKFLGRLLELSERETAACRIVKKEAWVMRGALRTAPEDL